MLAAILDPVSSMDNDDDHTEIIKETKQMYRRYVIARTSFYIHINRRRVGANLWSVILNS